MVNEILESFRLVYAQLAIRNLAFAFVRFGKVATVGSNSYGVILLLVTVPFESFAFARFVFCRSFAFARFGCCGKAIAAFGNFAFIRFVCYEKAKFAENSLYR